MIFFPLRLRSGSPLQPSCESRISWVDLEAQKERKISESPLKLHGWDARVRIGITVPDFQFAVTFCG
jgi:hypothetical protein